MILKRWFAWMCLALVLVAEVALFHSYRDRNALQTQLSTAQAQLYQTNKDLDVLRNADVGKLAAEITRLGKVNQILTNKVIELETAILPLVQASQSNALHLAMARQALQMQRDHLQELQTENSQIVDATSAVMDQNDQKTCINNLRLIDDAKQEWAKDTAAPNSAIPTQKDLLPYLKDNVFPVCPSGGIYSINAVDEVPTCSISTHSLPQ